MGVDTHVEVDGHRLKLSNLDKVLYPEAGFLKAQVIDYYTRIAPVLVPHLRDRPLTLVRYPDGVEGEHFFEKQCPSHRPDWVETVPVWSDRNNRHIRFCVANERATLVWTANLAALELHPQLHTSADLDRPTVMVFDLDPGPPATIVDCTRVAILLRDLFATLDLQAFPKTSGSKGLQVYVPLNTPVDYAATKGFSRTVAQLLERQHPDLVVSNMAKELRGGKVLIDWSQNDDNKTTVAVYSLRARARPTVSTPVTWAEVEATAESGDGGGLVFTATDVLDRVDRHGDLFEPVLSMEQALPSLAGTAP